MCQLMDDAMTSKAPSSPQPSQPSSKHRIEAAHPNAAHPYTLRRLSGTTALSPGEEPPALHTLALALPLWMAPFQVHM